MPIKRFSPTVSVPLRPTPSYLFTGRDTEREILKTFFADLSSARTRPDKAIVNPFGVSGIGKTALVQTVLTECESTARVPRLVFVDLDSDRWTPQSSVTKFFWYLRSQLGLPTPSFDYLYFLLWRAEHPGEKFNIEDGVIRALLQNLGKLGGMAGATSSAFQAGGLIGGSVHFLDKLATRFRDRWRRSVVADQLGLTPEQLTQKQLQDSLAVALHADIAAWLSESADISICVIVDGFERVQSRALAEDIQKHFEQLCGYISDPEAGYAGRAGFLIVGRERLRWGELYDPEWNSRIISWRISGISDADAREFFRKAGRYHRSTGYASRDTALSTHEDLLLSVTREDTSDDSGPSYHPYFLDLAYDLVRRSGERFTPQDLGQSSGELQIRFLRYLQSREPDILRAFQSLALAGAFNRDLRDHLAKAGHVPTGVSFDSLIGGDYSFVYAVPTSSEDYRFHALMENALLRSQVTRSEITATVVHQINCILEFFARRARFDSIAECSTEHLTAYERAMTVVFERYDNGLVDIVKLFHIVQQLEEPFGGDTMHARLRIPWFKRLLVAYDEQQGSNGDVIMYLMNNIGHLLASTDDLEAAESTYRNVLTVSEQVWGVDHPKTLSLMANLAPILQMRGRVKEAESLYSRVLRISEQVDGTDQRQVLHCIGNLTTLLSRKGDYAAAKQLGLRAVELAQRIHGPDARETLLATNNLALILQELGELDLCETLSKRLLNSCERTLGEDHGFTLVSLDNLGMVQQKRGQLAVAESLFRRALSGSQRTFGSEATETLIRMNNLAHLLQTKGDITNAEALHRESLDGLERRLGPEHPDVISVVCNLSVCLLQYKGDVGGARPLCDRAVEMSQRILGEENVISLRAVNNLGLLREAEGNLSEAARNYQKALDGLARLCGPDHALTVTVRDNLMRLHQRLDLAARCQSSPTD